MKLENFLDLQAYKQN